MQPWNILFIQSWSVIRAWEAINTEDIKPHKNTATATVGLEYTSDAKLLDPAAWQHFSPSTTQTHTHESVSEQQWHVTPYNDDCTFIHCRFSWTLFRMLPYTKLYRCSLDMVPSSCTVTHKHSASLCTQTHRRTATQTLTHINPWVLHDFSMFHIHGPDVSVKQTGWVRHSVVSWTEHTQHKHISCVSGWTYVDEARHSPPPLFAFFVWNGNKVALVEHIDQRSVCVRENHFINHTSHTYGTFTVLYWRPTHL